MNVIDFLKINGHKTFSVLPFCEVDALIMAQLAYMNYSSIITSFEDIVDTSTLNAYETSILLSKRPFAEKDIDAKFIQEVLSSKRYYGMRWAHYVDDHIEKQFNAITFIFDDFICVSYMGTDESIIGWKEDFSMSYLPEIASHKEGIKYLEKIASKYDMPLVLMGHSKGGNIAIYSYLNSSVEIQKRILKVYSYDAPGFNKQITLDETSKLIIESYIPESSIVGLIMYQVGDYKIIASDKSFVYQHNIYNWLVDEFGFIFKDKLTKRSVAFSESNKQWMESFSSEERRIFFETLFELFESNKIKKLSDLKKNSREKISKIIDSSSKITKENKELMKSIIKSMISLYLRLLFDRKN